MDAEDVDVDDDLYFSAEQKPIWASFDPSTRLLSGIPARGDTGTHNVVLAVSDGEFIQKQSFTIEVKFKNFAPVITSIPEDTAKVSKSYTYGISATDAEKDPITYFVSELPEWLEYYPSSRVIIGVPEGKDIGSHLVILGATDGIDTTYDVYTLEVIFETGLKDHESTPALSIYPNPASDFLNIKIDNTEPDDLLIFELRDMKGSIVMTEKITSSNTQISLRNRGMKEGVYFYRLKNSSAPQPAYPRGKIIIIR
jgi:hypothetical protein